MTTNGALVYTRASMAQRKTALQRIRDALGFSSRRVAEHLKIDISGLHRIETGENIPTRPTANKLYRFYGGHVPLGVIYDARHPSSQEWFRTVGQHDLKLVTHANLLANRYPKLLVRVRARS